MNTTHQPFAISNTRIHAFSCPHYFYNEYIAKDSSKYEHYDYNKPLMLRIGQFIHRVIEVYTKRLVHTGQESDMQTLNDVLSQEWQGIHYIPEEEYEEIEKMLYSFAEKNPIDPDYTLDAELEIALNRSLQRVAWDAEDAWVRMKLDRVDIYGTTGKIIDYKTSFFVPAESDIKKNLQGKIYAWGLHIINPYLEKFEVEFNYIRWGIKRTITYRLSDIERIENQLIAFTEKINAKLQDKNSEWPAIINYNTCAICQYQCPLIDSGVSIIRTEVDAIEMANKLLAMENEIKNTKEKLKNWCKATESFIKVNTGIFGFHPSQTIKISANDLITICKDNNADPFALMKIDTDAIKKMPDGKLKDELLSVSKITDGVRFGFLKDVYAQ